MNEIKILGLTDERTTCDCCGKTGLKVTVALEIDGGETLYYGRDCAGMVRFGTKSSNNTKKVASEAAFYQRVNKIFAAREFWSAANPGAELPDNFTVLRFFAAA